LRPLRLDKIGRNLFQVVCGIMGQSQCAGNCFNFLAASPKAQGADEPPAAPSSGAVPSEAGSMSVGSATSMWQPSAPSPSPAEPAVKESGVKEEDAGTSVQDTDSLQVATPKARSHDLRPSAASPVAAALTAALAAQATSKEVKAVSPNGATITDRESTACTTSTACTEKTGENAADDLLDIDLGKLCAALGTLERSAAEGREVNVDEKSAGHSRSSSWQPPVAEASLSRASEVASGASTYIRPSHRRQASEGTGRSRNSGGSTPATREGQVQGSRARDAQRMEAWFQRVLAKTPEAPDKVKSQTEAGPTSVSPVVPQPAEPVPDRLSEAQTSAEKAGDTVSMNQADLKLEVCLGGSQLGTLLFQYGQDLHEVCNNFVTSHHLRDVFRSPLEAHVELLVHMGKKTDSVDVVDLL